MEDVLSLKDAFSIVLDDYCKTFKVEYVPVNISITEDMAQTYSELRPDHAAMQPDVIEQQNNNNGTIVPPKYLDGSFTILLNSNYVKECINDENLSWFGTIAHEMTHVIDFVNFIKLTNETDYDAILDKNKYRMFHLWTEFNAKAKGYYFIRKHAFSDLYDEGQVPYILKTELPFQINTMLESYNSTDDGDKQLYYIVHFIGRMYVWQKLFPRYFSDDAIKEIFVVNPWMYMLYKFLASHTELERAYNDFDDMKKILKLNFHGL